MANCYSNKPYFRWWVHEVLNKHDSLVNKIKSMCKKNIFNLGLEDPLTVEYALRIDQESGSTLWN